MKRALRGIEIILWEGKIPSSRAAQSELLMLLGVSKGHQWFVFSAKSKEEKNLPKNKCVANKQIVGLPNK